MGGWGRAGLAAGMALLMGSGGAWASGPEPSAARMRIWAGGHAIEAEVAADPRSRARGLMGRGKLGEREGMLFAFPKEGIHCFWMEGTPEPLSIAFIRSDGGVESLRDMEPFSRERICPKGPVRYALEMRRGWFAERGIAPGARVERGPRR